MTGKDASLVGREGKLSRLGELMAPPYAERRVLVVLGDPGVGKTALMAEAAREAGPTGMRALAAAGRESEQDLGDLLPTITTPTQVVAGRNDDLVPWSNNQYLSDLLPNSEVHPLEAGHFAWEETPKEYGHLVADWISGGYRRLAR